MAKRMAGVSHAAGGRGRGVGTMLRCPRQPEWRSPRGRRAAQRSRTYRRNVATLIVVAALLTPLAVASLWVLSNVESSTAGDADIVVEVVQGWTPAQVGDALEKAGVIDSSAAFQAVAVSSGYGSYYAGNYDFVAEQHPTRSARHAARRSAPERARPRAAPAAGAHPRADRRTRRQARGQERAAFLAAAASGSVRSRYEPAEINSLEGLTWPDTYFIGANETETEILQKIVDPVRHQADARLGPPVRTAVQTPYQAVIDASLIEAEAGSKEDAPLISAVIATG